MPRLTEMRSKLSVGLVHRAVTSIIVATMTGVLICCCSQPGCDGAPASPADGSTDAGADVDGRADAHEADASECPDPTQGIPADIPEGWVRAPCAPLDCHIYLAPDASLARPPSPWVSCGRGCSELVHDWGDPSGRFFAELGASRGDQRFIGYTRNLDGDPLEIQIVRLPDNVVTFNALLPRGFGDRCFLWLEAVSAKQTLLEAHVHTQDIYINRRLVMTMPTGEAMPQLILDHTDSLYPLESVVTKDLWATTYGRRILYWHLLERDDDMLEAWESPDGRMLHTLSAVGSTVLFSTTMPGLHYQAYAWHRSEGVRTLLSFPEVEHAGAGCVLTDGIDMVWFQGTGFDAATETFAAVELVGSPFASHAADVRPRTLRPAYQDYLLGTQAAIGGGYALHREAKLGVAGVYQLTLTRLSDGAYWIIEPRPGFHWNLPLYVDAEELAVSEGADREIFRDAGLKSGESYTIVRRTIASLGPPTLGWPDALPGQSPTTGLRR